MTIQELLKNTYKIKCRTTNKEYFIGTLTEMTYSMYEEDEHGFSLPSIIGLYENFNPKDWTFYELEFDKK